MSGSHLKPAHTQPHPATPWCALRSVWPALRPSSWHAIDVLCAGSGPRKFLEADLEAVLSGAASPHACILRREERRHVRHHSLHSAVLVHGLRVGEG